MMQNISQDRESVCDFKTGLYFAVTSSRPIKATLKGLKIATSLLKTLLYLPFSWEILQGKTFNFQIFKRGLDWP